MQNPSVAQEDGHAVNKVREIAGTDGEKRRSNYYWRAFALITPDAFATKREEKNLDNEHPRECEYKGVGVSSCSNYREK